MGGKSAFLLREKAAHAREVLASIGQGLREQYDPAPPFYGRLAEIERSTNGRKADDASRGRLATSEGKLPDGCESPSHSREGYVASRLSAPCRGTCRHCGPRRRLPKQSRSACNGAKLAAPRRAGREKPTDRCGL